MASGERLLLFLVTSLLISSVLVAWFLMQAYGIAVAGITLPNANQIYSSTQDFSTNSINTSIWYSEGGGIYRSSQNGEWQYAQGIGRVLQYPFIFGLNQPFIYLIIDKVQKDNSGKIVNTYKINNSVNAEDYIIILRKTGGYDENAIIVKPDGFHIPNYDLVAYTYSDRKFYPFTGFTKVASIKTEYNDNLNTVSLYYNNQLIFTYTDLHEDANILGVFERQFGGIGARTTGFTVITFTSDNVISEKGNSASSITDMIAFIVTILKITLWNVDVAFLPWEVNIVLIKTQDIGVLICAYYALRG